MKTLLETIGGVYELARLAALSRGRFRTPYWRWRVETAFGRGLPPRRELFTSIVEYGRWCYRMRRLR